MLVVAFAIAGTIDIDLTSEPLGQDADGQAVYLKDIWPSAEEIQSLVQKHVKQRYFQDEYAKIFDGDQFWQKLPVAEGTTFEWQEQSTYIRKPPYFEGFALDIGKPADVQNAGVLLILGDSLTTDHISPAGAIPPDYPAGQYLIEKKVAPDDFNSYGSRRGNHEVMMRGTFGNIRIKNRLVDPKEGSYTLTFPEREEMFVYDAAMQYLAENKPQLVLGGKEYGTGSSRDWAAKGSQLLGIKAVIAESFERIHRSNLVGMGVLPLTFNNADSWQSLGLDGSETYTITGIDSIAPLKTLGVQAVKPDGSKIEFDVTARLNTDIDVAYFKHGGILPYVLRKIMRN
jgi:aconitate hydratase